MTENEQQELETLRLKAERQDQLLESYRETMGRLALTADKNHAWGMMVAWSPYLRLIGFDLKTPEQQKAFIFGL